MSEQCTVGYPDHVDQRFEILNVMELNPEWTSAPSRRAPQESPLLGFRRHRQSEGG